MPMFCPKISHVWLFYQRFPQYLWIIRYKSCAPNGTCRLPHSLPKSSAGTQLAWFKFSSFQQPSCAKNIRRFHIYIYIYTYTVECSHKGRDPIPIDDASNTRIHNQENGPGHGLDENQMKLMLLGCPQPPMPLLWLRRKMGVHTPFSLGHCRVVNPSWAFRTAIADHR